MNKLSDGAEEILESLWVEVVEKKSKPSLRMLKDEPYFGELVEGGYIDPNKETLLTEKGLAESEKCVRRHRLSERLVKDLLDIKEDFIHETSCKFEHGLHHGLEDKICTLLGHPKTCPHGKLIPPGKCCKISKKISKQLIVPLKELSPQDRAKISYINTRDRDVLKKLIAMGILPGNIIRLLHRFPSFIFEMNNSNYAVDKDLAEYIYVIPLESD